MFVDNDIFPTTENIWGNTQNKCAFKFLYALQLFSQHGIIGLKYVHKYEVSKYILFWFQCKALILSSGEPFWLFTNDFNPMTDIYR